jgi:xylulokinase
LVPEYFIGIDSGTQSTKALVMDGETGKVLATAVEAYGLIEGLPPGHMEQHPDTWIGAVRSSVKRALEEANVEPRKVAGIGVSGQQHGFVPLDAEGKVIRPAKLWCDTSTEEQCRFLIEALGGLKRVIELIGNGIPPGFTASKILWLKQREPENYRRLKTVLLPHDYINFWLTGNLGMEYGDASGTALMDVRARKWCPEVIDAIDPKLFDKLPELGPSDRVMGLLRPEVARLFGLRDDVIVSSGGGDNMMAAIGTGNTREGIVTASLGTSGTIYACSEHPVIDPQGELAAFCDSTNRWLPLVCTMNVTVATELVRRFFGYSHEELARAIEKAPPGAGGLLFIPYLRGERMPNVPEGTGVYFGINEKTLDKAYLIRATVEGVTMGLNYGLRRMRSLGISPTQIRLTGGGSKNPSWRQVVADVFNTPVVAMLTEEGAAFGAAIQAKWAYDLYLGKRISIWDLTDRIVKTDPRTVAYPNPDAVAVYGELQELYEEVSMALRMRAFRLHRKYILEHP